MKVKRTLKNLWIGFFIFATSFVLSSSVLAAGDEILIGSPISMTGGFAASGLEQLWAYKRAIAKYNAEGGIYIKSAGKKLPIRLVTADDESDPAKAAQAVEKLIRLDNVDLMLSTHSGPLNVPAANAAEKYKTYYHITTCWPFMWVPNKFQWSSLMFFTAANAAESPFKIWDSLPKADRPQRPGMLIEDSPDGGGFGGGIKHFAKEHGYTFVVDEPWAVGAKDYSSQVLKMKYSKVDAIILFGSPSDSITVMRQIKEMGLKVKYIHGFKGTWSAEFADALGKDADYVVADGFWSESFPYPGAKELGEAYTKEYKKYSVSVGAFYANAQTLLMAIEKTQSYDSTTIRNAFRNTTYENTVMGTLNYDEKGLALINAIAIQWWQGKQKLFWPPQEGGWKLKLME